MVWCFLVMHIIGCMRTLSDTGLNLWVWSISPCLLLFLRFRSLDLLRVSLYIHVTLELPGLYISFFFFLGNRSFVSFVHVSMVGATRRSFFRVIWW